MDETGSIEKAKKLYQIGRRRTPQDGNHHRQQLFEQQAMNELTDCTIFPLKDTYHAVTMFR
jgi:hypothetical protein